MNTMNLRVIVGGLILTVLICTGFWLYTQWDTKRFEESLQIPSVMEAPREETTARQTKHPQEIAETTENAISPTSMRDAEKETNKPDTAAPSESANVTGAAKDTAGTDSFFDQWLEQTIGDSTDVSEEVPYDMAIVKAGFDDYNAHLQSDPEYAYQRLDDAFREQYGDDPDVDILVDTIKRGNSGPMAIDDAIKWMEAMMRLVSKISPPEALENIQDALEMLTIAKQMAQEDGIDIEYEGNFHIGE